jgi:hypothetical protein
MKVDRVTYRRLVTDENYSNRAIEASAQVEPGEQPEETLRALRGWVGLQLCGLAPESPDPVAIAERIERLRDDAERLDASTREQRRAINRMREEERELWRRAGCLDAYMGPCVDAPIPF